MKNLTKGLVIGILAGGLLAAGLTALVSRNIHKNIVSKLNVIPKIQRVEPGYVDTKHLKIYKSDVDNNGKKEIIFGYSKYEPNATWLLMYDEELQQPQLVPYELWDHEILPITETDGKRTLKFRGYDFEQKSDGQWVFKG